MEVLTLDQVAGVVHWAFGNPGVFIVLLLALREIRGVRGEIFDALSRIRRDQVRIMTRLNLPLETREG
jgi:hypothetical protein